MRWWILEYLVSEKFVLASESNLSFATALASWKVSRQPCKQVTSTEISREREINKETLLTKEISCYCFFTAVYRVCLPAAFGCVRPRRGWEIRPTAVNSRQNPSARTRFYRVLMGKYFQAVLYVWIFENGVKELHPRAWFHWTWRPSLGPKNGQKVEKGG